MCKSKSFLLSTTSRDLCYLSFKSCCNLLKVDCRKLGRRPNIVLTLLVVMFAIGIPVVSFLMDFLLACSKTPIFPREVKRGDVLKQSSPLRGIREKRGLCSCLVYQQISPISGVLDLSQQAWSPLTFALSFPVLASLGIWPLDRMARCTWYWFAVPTLGV